MSVCVELLGRLGNNLFQIACAAGYSVKHNVELYIPNWEYANCFQTDFTKHSTGTTNYGEKSFCYEELPFIENVKLFGWFQSEKYFKHCEGKIRELFRFNDAIRDKMNAKYANLLNGSVTCSIHHRRTDYIGSQLHDVCGEEYYKGAFKEIKKRTSIDVFLIFSDDINWCKQNISGENFVFIEDNSDIEDLFLMTKSTHNIICNSTFSWWGSWLGDNKDKIVIAPEIWLNSTGYDTRDVLPEEWVKVKVK